MSDYKEIKFFELYIRKIYLDKHIKNKEKMIIKEKFVQDRKTRDRYYLRRIKNIL